ncbi:MAG: cysteine hydrolase [Deltaproteobacteria bacterium]|nr:cysteine hydrolase [Deltaproteobacteria bacterium]
MLEIAGKKIPDTLEEIIDPGRTALLLWDMEYAIAPNAFNFEEIVANLKPITDLARKIGVPVFYSQQIAFDLEKQEAEAWVRVRMKRASGSTQEAKIPAGKKGHDIIDELAPKPGDAVFQKRRPDGFAGTDFDIMLRNKGIKTVIVGGVATEGGVEGTARTGRNLGYYMVILKDCVGSRNRELHDMALNLMEKTQFDVATANQVAEIWRRKM